MFNHKRTPITAASEGIWIEEALNNATQTARAIQANHVQPQPITINITYAPVTNIDNRQVIIVNAPRHALAQCHPSRQTITGNMDETWRRLQNGESLISRNDANNSISY